MKHTFTIRCALPALALAASPALAADLPSPERMWEIIQQQQREIMELKRQQKATEEKVEATGEMLDRTGQAGTGEQVHDTGKRKAALGEEHGAFEHGSSGKTLVGGYGELHYNNLDSGNEIDFHRAILFLGHEFSDRIRFFSEIEYEHANTDRNGAVELEQAYLEFDLNPGTRARAGLFLVPAGILNETHEPPTFYGVERNPVEKYIIPTTWWVGGAALEHELAPGLGLDLAVHEGMNTRAANGYGVRAGRQSTSEADANDLAGTVRVKWTGLPGVKLAASVQYQQDITQGNDANAGDALLYEANAVLRRGPFGLRALYAMWDLDGAGPKAIGADEQRGFYIEPSWRIHPKLGLFARYNQWDNTAGRNGGKSERIQYNAGASWWPHPDVVLKADLQVQDNEGSRKNDNGFNLGVGYQF